MLYEMVKLFLVIKSLVKFIILIKQDGNTKTTEIIECL